MKKYLLIAGVNGAGKTAFFNNPRFKSIFENTLRLNADEILRENGWFWKDFEKQIKAMKIVSKRMSQYIQDGISFNRETTLSGVSDIKHIEKVKEKGFLVNMYYIGLNDVNVAKERIAVRVANGGHGVSDETVERRYKASLENLKRAIKVCDNVFIYDNTSQLKQIAHFECGKLVEINMLSCAEWFAKAILLGEENE